MGEFRSLLRIKLPLNINCMLMVSLSIFGFLSVAIAADPAKGETPSQGRSVAVVQNPNQIFPTPDYSGDFLERSTLSGEWFGVRQDLANRGVTLDANLTQVQQSVFSGGRDTGSAYMGRGEVDLNLDTAKLGLWPGGLLSFIAEGNFGNTLTDNTGSLLGTNANDLFPESDNSFIIPQVVFTQFLSKEFGISLGKISTITSTSGDMNEFAHGKGSQQFLNPAFNFTPITALTIPYSTLGAALLFLPFKELVIAASVLDPHGAPDSAGFDELFSNGATFALEGRYTTHFSSMTGHQLLGGTFSTSSYVDLDQRAANLIFPGLPVEEADNSWSLYYNGDQYFYQPDSKVDKGIGVFARLGLSDGIANPIHQFASTGIGGKGMIPGRENDGFGIGYYYSWIADNRLLSTLDFKDAQGLEVYYELAITPWLHVTPDLQWIQPSQQQIDSSWLAAGRLYMVF